MIRLAEILSQPFDFVRADFYNIKGRIIFGEMTHYPGNAITEFEPAEFNLTMGGYWRLEY